jgi:hypothetical protein
MSRARRHSAARLAPALGATLLALGACAEAGPSAPASPPDAPALAIAGSPPATPSLYTFSNCVGPAPSTFQAEKIQLPDAARYVVAQTGAFRLTDGSAVFVVLNFGVLGFNPPGVGRREIATVTCDVSLSIGVVQFSGFMTKAP